MRILPVLAITGLLVGVAAWFLLRRPSTLPSDEADAPAGAVSAPRPPYDPNERPVRIATTGRLVVRVKTSDGSPVPEGTKAGYVYEGVPRMRRPDRDGTFPFSDAPVSVEMLEAVADAPGYTAERVKVKILDGNVASEAVVVLTPVK